MRLKTSADEWLLCLARQKTALQQTAKLYVEDISCDFIN